MTTTVVCATDLSPSSLDVALAAGAIARRLGARVALVHAAAESGPELDAGTARALGEQAARIVREHHVELETSAGHGSAREAVGAAAAKAQLVVVSALGSEQQRQRLLEGVAEHVAQSVATPVLLVRDAAKLRAWAEGRRTLRVMVGVELNSTSRAALTWAIGLRSIGKCDLVVVQIAWPPAEHERLGVPSPMPLDRLRPEVEDTLLRDLRAWVGEPRGEGETRLEVRPGYGRVDAHLALLAERESVDLLVVGTHQRQRAARIWKGSVSRGVLHRASTSVACVPSVAGAERGIPTYRHVLVPTDFSMLANRAVPVAFGLVAPGGIVHLLHVTPGASAESESVLLERLRALVPAGAAARDVATDVEVVRAERASLGISHVAGRLNVDAICMGTHGLTGALQLVLGSEARDLVGRARQPVILVPPERPA